MKHIIFHSAHLICLLAFGFIITPFSLNAQEAVDSQTLATNNQKFVHRERGIKAKNDGNYKNAITEFTAYKALSTNDPDCYLDAVTLLAESTLRSAPEQAQKIINDYEKNTKPNKHSEFYPDYIRIKIAILIYNSQFAEAKAFLKKFLTEFPDNHEMSLLLIDICLLQCSYGEAQLLFERYEDKSPEFLLRQFKLSLHKEDYKQAEEILETLKGTTLSPTTISLYQVLLYIAQDELTKAQKIYEAIEDKRPFVSNYDWWQVSQLLAAASVANKQYNEALRLYDQSWLMALTSRDKAIARLAQANILVQQDKLDDAVSLLLKFRKQYSHLEEFYLTDLQIGDLMRAKKRYEDAYLYYSYVADNQAALLKKRYIAKLNCGFCRMETEDYAKAINEFKTAATYAETPKESSQTLQHLAHAYYMAKDYAQSAKTYREIFDNYQDLDIAEDALRNQSRILYDGKLYAEAIEAYKLYLQTYPEGRHKDIIQQELGITLRNNKNYDEALNIFCKILIENPAAENRPTILQEAYKTALLKNDPQKAAQFTGEITEKYSNTAYYIDALYWQTYLAFAMTDPKAAELANRFISETINHETPPVERITDIQFWLADYHTYKHDYENARSNYQAIFEISPNSPAAATALYEAMCCSIPLKTYEDGLTLFAQLEKHPDFKDIMKQRALYIKSDLHIALKQYDKAAETIHAIIEIVTPNSDDYWFAKIRLAEILLILGNVAELETSGETVKQHFRNIVTMLNDTLLEQQDNIPSNLRDQMLLLKAEALEELAEQNQAFETYYDILLNYTEEYVRNNHEKNDWRILERAAFRAADIAVKLQNYEVAIRIYQRLLRMNLPLKQEANIRLTNLVNFLKTNNK